MIAQHVVVGILINSDDHVLIAKRAADKHMGNKWEFPGGKVEKGETPEEALYREMREELGIDVKSAEFLTNVVHEYDDKKVILDVYEIRKWQGEAQGMEQQPVLWVEKQVLRNYEFPAANIEILLKIN